MQKIANQAKLGKNKTLSRVNEAVLVVISCSLILDWTERCKPRSGKFASNFRPI